MSMDFALEQCPPPEAWEPDWVDTRVTIWGPNLANGNMHLILESLGLEEVQVNRGQDSAFEMLHRCKVYLADKDHSWYVGRKVQELLEFLLVNKADTKDYMLNWR